MRAYRRFSIDAPRSIAPPPSLTPAPRFRASAPRYGATAAARRAPEASVEIIPPPAYGGCCKFPCGGCDTCGQRIDDFRPQQAQAHEDEPAQDAYALPAEAVAAYDLQADALPASVVSSQQPAAHDATAGDLSVDSILSAVRPHTGSDWLKVAAGFLAGMIFDRLIGGGR